MTAQTDLPPSGLLHLCRFITRIAGFCPRSAQRLTIRDGISEQLHAFCGLLVADERDPWDFHRGV